MCLLVMLKNKSTKRGVSKTNENGCALQTALFVQLLKEAPYGSLKEG